VADWQLTEPNLAMSPAGREFLRIPAT